MNETGERDLETALKWGWRRKCPNCGRGAMMKSYLSVGQIRPECGQVLFHRRAGERSAYLMNLIVGHLMAPALL